MQMVVESGEAGSRLTSLSWSGGVTIIADFVSAVDPLCLLNTVVIPCYITIQLYSTTMFDYHLSLCESNERGIERGAQCDAALHQSVKAHQPLLHYVTTTTRF